MLVSTLVQWLNNDVQKKEALLGNSTAQVKLRDCSDGYQCLQAASNGDAPENAQDWQNHLAS